MDFIIIFTDYFNMKCKNSPGISEKEQVVDGNGYSLVMVSL